MWEGKALQTTLAKDCIRTVGLLRLDQNMLAEMNRYETRSAAQGERSTRSKNTAYASAASNEN